MSSAGVNTYRSVAANTASRGDILLALYDGAIRYGEVARQAILRGDPAAKGAAIDALLAIIMEFTCTLDSSKSPELCQKLVGLYNYFTVRIQQAGVRMEVAPLDEVLQHLKGLRETWGEAVKLAKQEGVV